MGRAKTQRQASTPTLDLRPIGGRFGVELHGIDLGGEISEDISAAIEDVLHEHLVVAVRDQSLNPDSLHRLARRFGPFSGNPIHVPMEGFEDIVKVVREPDDTGPTFGGNWHMDLAWFEEPPGATILYAEEAPAAGGDTLFANLHLAYDALSDGMKAMIANLTVVHSGDRVFAVNAALHSVAARETGRQASMVQVEHPLVCHDRLSGRPYLFVSSVMRRFKGMSEEESRPIIEFLQQHAVRPEFTCRLSWVDGTLGIWQSNRLLHYAIGDYAGSRRIVYRTTVAGHRPQ